MPDVNAVAPRESVLGRAYRTLYEGLCGRHPRVRPWHFQWLDGFYLYRGLRRVLPGLSGRVLDAGCGGKPYQAWFGQVTEYVGLDVVAGPSVDVIVAPDQPWPLPDGHVDVLLASQMLEHAEHLDLTVKEMRRVVRPGGQLLLTFPFLYNEHGTPYDFQRFTVHRAVKLVPGCEVLLVERQGGLGSTLVLLFLNWAEQSLNLTFIGRLLKAPLLPVWVLVCLVLNLGGLVVDRLDRTGAYYNNIMILLRKAG